MIDKLRTSRLDRYELTVRHPVSKVARFAFVIAIDEAGLELIRKETHCAVDRFFVRQDALYRIEPLDWCELLEVDLVASCREDMLHFPAVNKCITC